jgi:hypothetical protein
MNDNRDEIDETVAVLAKAAKQLKASIRVEAELRNKIERQGAQITMALGYIRGGRADLAGLVLGGSEQDAAEYCTWQEGRAT